jgi:mono/diheme cytochrome c family protein
VFRAEHGAAEHALSGPESLLVEAREALSSADWAAEMATVVTALPERASGDRSPPRSPACAARLAGRRAAVLLGDRTRGSGVARPMPAVRAALVVLACTLVMAAGAQDAATVEHGRQVFAYGARRVTPRARSTQALRRSTALYKGGKPAPLEQRTDLVPTITQTFVRTGVSVMPPFRKTEISDADLAALAAYLAPRAH